MYQCPNCSANIKFNIAKQALYCDHCETVMQPEDLIKDKDAETEKEMEVTIMRCPQCGGEIISDDNEAAVFCSFCGGSTILDSRLQKTKRPSFIIPFKKTKQDCISGYKKRINKNIFAPSAMKKGNLEQSFRGIYMPYWSYDYKQENSFTVDGTKSYSKGNYRYTEHHDISVPYRLHYEGLAHDASSSFADNLSEAIAPYDPGERVPFTASYLSGFYADAFDVDSSVYESDMNAMAAGYSYNRVEAERAFIGYSVNSADAKKRMEIKSTGRQLVMLPVWFMSTRVKDKGQDRIAYSVVNGQTGRVAGDMPISFGKYLYISLIVSAVIFALMHYCMDMVYSPVSTAFWISVLSFVMGIINHVREGKIKASEKGDDDKGILYVEHRSVKQDKDKTKVKKKFLEHTFMWAPLAVTVILFFGDFIHDYYYYGATIFGILIILRIILMTVSRFNMLCTRPLPQFKRKGGDDRA